MCSMFVPLLVLCLLTRPAVAHTFNAILTCDDVSFNSSIRPVVGIIYLILAQMEQISIAAVSFLRMMATWSPLRHSVGLKRAVAVVVSITLYCIVTTLGLIVPKELGYLKPRHVWWGIRTLFVFNIMVPILVTIACYALMIYTMYRNYRRLSVFQHTNSRNVEATRSMLAVFISNLLLGFPYPVFYLQGKKSFTMNVIFRILFSSHFIVDPVVFVWFNRSFRHRVGEKVGAGVAWMSQRISRTSPTATVTTISSISLSPLTVSINRSQL
ncbi:rhodopsin-like isoform X2 [Cherax quadricarinatus]|uniref:rhodopsin-like isoform X2 n=1 Tax=Cherax quadricarinatus TaxID=27406 RepID=UPI00237833F6|nr:rhodopsin-like isoform X2 [Cherax quadricarinatus]